MSKSNQLTLSSEVALTYVAISLDHDAAMDQLKNELYSLYLEVFQL